jgi:hypothetical protein
MADSIRQQIITALDTRLKLIKTTGGYKTNAGNNVFDWLDRDLADTELDAIIYRDRTDDIQHNLIDVYTHKVRVEIEAKAKSAATTASQIRKIMDDILKAIGVDDTWGGLAQDTNPLSTEIDIQKSDKIAGEAKINIEIEYDASKWTQ